MDKIKFPFSSILGLVGHRFFPINLGIRKFRNYLDIHSRATSKRVPDDVIRKIVERAYSGSIIGERSDVGTYVACLATTALLLIDYLENTEKALAIDPTGTLIDHTWLLACGVNLPTEGEGEPSDESEPDESFMDPELADAILSLDPRIQSYEKSLGGRKLTVQEKAELLLAMDAHASASDGENQPSRDVERVKNVALPPPAFSVMSPKELHDFHLKAIDRLRRTDEEKRQKVQRPEEPPTI